MVVAKQTNAQTSVASSSSATPAIPPQVVMLQMANAYRTSQAIHVAAKLGIADQLSDRPKNIQELAAATQTHPPSLYRLLRALASMGIFAETEAGDFELTPRAALLQSNVPGSLRDYAIVIGDDWHWQMWGDILSSVHSGNAAFDQRHQMGFLDYYAQNPAVAERFDRAMVSVLENVDTSILASYDFSTFGTIVDVGIPGGYGNLLIRLLQAHPTVQGVLFDLPAGLEQAKPNLAAQGVLDRCQLVAGNVFDSLPQGGDVYILKNLIHDWEQERILTVLQHCRDAMHNATKLLIVEMMVTPGNEPALCKILDVEALIMTPGAYERTEEQYRSLFATAGLTVTQVIPTRSPYSIIEAVRV